jgi:hypothetical protein
LRKEYERDGGGWAVQWSSLSRYDDGRSEKNAFGSRTKTDGAGLESHVEVVEETYDETRRRGLIPTGRCCTVKTTEFWMELCGGNTRLIFLISHECLWIFPDLAFSAISGVASEP